MNITALPSGGIQVVTDDGVTLTITDPQAAHDWMHEHTDVLCFPDAHLTTLAADTRELERQCDVVEELHRRVRRMADDPVRDNDIFDVLLQEFHTARSRLADMLSVIEIAHEPNKES
ncbi:MAG: hypothetical protein M3Q30_23945 [Actinomycetota bacterium]|nr:hypothetical protein [Actinomycetota bacterium]